MTEKIPKGYINGIPVYIDEILTRNLHSDMVLISDLPQALPEPTHFYNFGEFKDIPVWVRPCNKSLKNNTSMGSYCETVYPNVERSVYESHGFVEWRAAECRGFFGPLKCPQCAPERYRENKPKKVWWVWNHGVEKWCYSAPFEHTGNCGMLYGAHQITYLFCQDCKPNFWVESVEKPDHNPEIKCKNCVGHGYGISDGARYECHFCYAKGFEPLEKPVEACKYCRGTGEILVKYPKGSNIKFSCPHCPVEKDPIVGTKILEKPGVQVDGSLKTTTVGQGIIKSLEANRPLEHPVPLTRSTEFDMRHLHGCPQFNLRPGNSCSCNVVLRDDAGYQVDDKPPYRAIEIFGDPVEPFRPSWDENFE